MPAESSNNASPHDLVGELEEIPVDQIVRNERNPRQTFDPNSIERLAESIEEVGLLVPITVYQTRTKPPQYMLLDGERRFRAAKLINKRTIPAMVVSKPNKKDNAVRMFNIHMLREDWREIETAWALNQIIQETGISSDRELQKLTGLSVDRIRNMRRVLGFPKNVQEKVARGDLPYQLLVEIDKNLLSRRREEIKAHETEPVVSLSVAELRNRILEKYEDKVEKDVVDLRRVGALFDTAKSDGKVAERARAALNKLVNEKSATIEEAYELGAASSVELSKVLRDIKALAGRIEDLLSSNLDEDQRRDVLRAIETLRQRLAKLA